ncbi:MAG TPA: hypothetical protein VKO87_14445 [Gemmatimonadaceae bacterium]|nr:hypothetical protein [Gemmatimonadaceae bacterium]
MTRAQFALAVRGDEKWIENAARLLGKQFRYSLEESVWLGLVRMLNQELQLPLSRAAELADEALGLGSDRPIVVGRSDQSSGGVFIDMPRFRSSHAAATSVALTLGGPRRRGRRATPSKKKADVIAAAQRYGVDIDLLREGLKLSPAERLEQLDANAAFVRSVRKVRKS